MYREEIPKIINVLSVINTDGIRLQNNYEENVKNIFILNDNNNFRQLGSSLQLYCKAGDIIRFRFSGIKSDSDVHLERFVNRHVKNTCLKDIGYDKGNSCWKAEVSGEGQGEYLWLMSINQKIIRIIVLIEIRQPIHVLGVIDCACAVENYENFGHYVYMMDSKNDAGTAESAISDSIEIMSIRCRHGDILYFYVRGITPSDMPEIEQLESDKCRFVRTPADRNHKSLWVAYVTGNSDGILECTVAMPDDTEHTFQIGLNIADTN